MCNFQVMPTKYIGLYMWLRINIYQPYFFCETLQSIPPQNIILQTFHYNKLPLNDFKQIAKQEDKFTLQNSNFKRNQV